MENFGRLICKENKNYNLLEIKNIFAGTDMADILIVEKDGKIVVKRDDTEEKVVEISLVEDIKKEKEILLDGVKGTFPEKSCEWVKKYLEESNKIYSFELFEGVDDEYGWYIFESIRESMWEECGGIIQTDGEGYRNEEGFFILWQFEEDVEGYFEAAVLDKNGIWNCFEMDLSNNLHIKSFKNGEVPKGVEILEF